MGVTGYNNYFLTLIPNPKSNPNPNEAGGKRRMMCEVSDAEFVGVPSGLLSAAKLPPGSVTAVHACSDNLDVAARCAFPALRPLALRCLYLWTDSTEGRAVSSPGVPFVVSRS